MSGEPIGSCTLRADSPLPHPVGVNPGQCRHPVGQPGWAGGQPVLAIEHVLQQVAGGVAGIGLGVDNQPRFRLRGQRGCLIPLLAAGEPERYLEHQIGAARAGDRCRP